MNLPGSCAINFPCVSSYERMNWIRKTLTEEFLSESCCFADMDGDGDDELVAGSYWWKRDGSAKIKFREIHPAFLPDWPHPHKPDPHPHFRRGTGVPAYKASTYDYLLSPSTRQLLCIGMHRDPIYVLTPGPERGDEWRRDEVIKGGIYESAILTNSLLQSRPALVTIPAKPFVAWYEPDADFTAPWTEHIIGEEGGDWHGLGVGDIDRDGRVEVITKSCAYFYDDLPQKPWRKQAIHQVTEDGSYAESLGDVFRIEVLNIPDQPAPILISSSPHRFGLWYWSLLEENAERRVYRRHVLNSDVSQLHSLQVRPLSMHEPAAIITGKRWHAHGPDGDVDANGTPFLLAFQFGSQAGELPAKSIIDDRSGVGIHFATRYDAAGRLEIATSNKRGVFLFSQQ